jgi:hypothetical protein
MKHSVMALIILFGVGYSAMAAEPEAQPSGSPITVLGCEEDSSNSGIYTLWANVFGWSRGAAGYEHKLIGKVAVSTRLTQTRCEQLALR